MQSSMFVLLKKQFIGWLSQLLVWIKTKNVLLEQGWAFAAKAMLLQGVGCAGGRSIYCLAFLPLPPVNPEVDFLPRLSLSLFCYRI